MTGFTPGPWNRNKYGSLLDSKGENILFRGVSIATSGSRVAEAEKNTDLAAAAPAMQQSLRPSGDQR
jgi:hypothetical protein